MTAPLLWPDDRSEKLRTLWANGWSARLCAEELGVSRNAIIGRVHRMGLEARGRVVSVDRGAKKHRRKPYARRIPHKIDAFGKPTAPVSFVPRIVEVDPLNIGFNELAENSCRYPTQENPIKFCGHPKQQASSYCASHHALCWVPWRPRMDREEFERNKRENFRAYKAELVEA